MDSQVVAEALGDFIGGLRRWQLFATLTMGRPGDGVSGSETRREGWTSYGVGALEHSLDRWFHTEVATRNPGRAVGLFTIEDHADRHTKHLHGMIGGLPWDVVDDVVAGFSDRSRAYLWESWKRVHGSARIERISEVGEVGLYVAKYCNKGLGKIYTFGLSPDCDICGRSGVASEAGGEYRRE